MSEEKDQKPKLLASDPNQLYPSPHSPHVGAVSELSIWTVLVIARDYIDTAAMFLMCLGTSDYCDILML